MNNRFSNKNKLVYKMKCINTRDTEYIPLKNNMYDRIDKYSDTIDKK